MARRPKTDTPPTSAGRGRKPKAAAASAAAPASEGDDTASAAANGGVAAPAEGSTPGRGRRSRKLEAQAGAMEPALPLASDMDQVADEASPPADGPEPSEDEADAPMAGIAVPVGSQSGGGSDPVEHEDAALQAGGAVPAPPFPGTSAPAAPAARWDRALDAVSFDWPAIEHTAAQDGPNQAVAKLLLAARAEGAHSRWPL